MDLTGGVAGGCSPQKIEQDADRYDGAPAGQAAELHRELVRQRDPQALNPARPTKQVGR